MTVSRVLMVHSGASLYGSDQCLLELACRLDRRRYEPVVVVPERGPLVEDLVRLGVEVHVMPLAVLRRLYSPAYLLSLPAQMLMSARCLGRFIREHRVDIVHTNTTHVLSSGLAARLAGVPHITHVREIPRVPRRLRRVLARFVGWTSDRVISISGAVRDQFLNDMVPTGRIRTIYDGIPLARFQDLPPRTVAQTQLGFEPDAPLVGTIGRLTPWKGHRCFLQAAAIVAARLPCVHFVIVGDADTPQNRSYRAELEAMTRELGLAGRVHFVGFQKEVTVFLAAMDVFVLCSSSPEPLGLVILEAMACGVPVVATNHGGPSELAEEGRCGLLVPPTDPQAMAEAILQIIGDAHLGAGLSERGRMRARQFSVEQNAAAVEAVYAELIG